MTLADVDMPVSLAWAQGKFLAFSQQLCQRLVNVQAWYGDPRNVPFPRPLTDGRWILSADVLTECIPGGLVYGGFSRLDPAGFVGIEVLTKEEVLPLMYGEEDTPPSLPEAEDGPPPEPHKKPEPDSL